MLHRAATLSDLKPDDILGVKLGDCLIALMLIDGTVYATDDVCSHALCQFSEYGIAMGLELECACHGGSFFIPTGEAMHLPATEPISVFPTTVMGSEVYIELPDE
ncbi:MAG TPA: Rieske 2Fe-2S domain-containing protein [Dehalococcoidia bacterium]|nr:Rieske 2Fe-2S domain-containing protein [Dehalococcoidia bacterium]